MTVCGQQDLPGHGQQRLPSDGQFATESAETSSGRANFAKL